MISSNNSNALLKIIEGNLSKNEVFEEEQLIQLITQTSHTVWCDEP